jgi:hypothetical protein
MKENLKALSVVLALAALFYYVHPVAAFFAIMAPWPGTER